METLHIRLAKPADSGSISELTSALSRKFITGRFDPRGAKFLLNTMTPEQTRKLIEQGYRYHVAEIDDSLVGVVAVKDNKHLYQLFVAEASQRQGIAKRLWQVAMEACLDSEDISEFTVNSSEYAQEVYKRLGFVAQPGPRIKNGVVFYPMRLQLGRKDQYKER